MTFALAHPWMTFWMFVFGVIGLHDMVCNVMNGMIYRERAKRRVSDSGGDK